MFLCVSFLAEASKSITPALVLSKFLKMYEEMAQNIEGDPWASVSAWAGEANRGEWEIRSGVNFMQFVDCLGVSYTNCTALPSVVFRRYSCSHAYVNYLHCICAETGHGGVQRRALQRDAANCE